MAVKWTSVLVGLFFVQTAFAQSASLELSPSSGAYKTGSSFSVKVVVDSGTTQVNAAEANITYDTAILSIKSFSKDGSSFTMWPVEPTFSNGKGTLDFSGGNTSAFSGRKTILTIVFEAKKAGDATVSISKGAVISPPTFTDILGEKKGATFTIEAGSAAVTPEPKTETKVKKSTGVAPDAPILTGIPFSDPETWYATTTNTFEWKTPYDVTAVKLLVDDKEASVPTVLYGSTLSSKTLTDIKEGETYFHVMFQNAAGWGVPAHRKMRVDVTPPKEFSVTASQDSPLSQDVTVRFKVEDALSGVAYYDISIDEDSPTKVLKDELLNGEYSLTAVEAGERSLSVTAYDLAGNSTVAETTFSVNAVVAKAVVEEEVVVDEGFDWGYWFILLLVAAVAFLFGAIVYERKAIRAEKELIKKEADETREKLEGIFSVLRDEVEEQVLALATKPNMTEFERGILEKLKEALEISEELLDKEIEDVRKLLQ